MSILSSDKPLMQLKPLFLPTPFWIAHRVEASDFSKQFNIGYPSFGALATEENFKALQSHLLEIDIQSEIAMLKADRYLEITLPMLDITDLSEGFKTLAQKFPCVVGINGFGASDHSEESRHFSRPDFMSVIDLVGNRYEILPQANGHIELPYEGIGRFTLIRAMIWVYSAEQIQGRSLKNLQHCHLSENNLYVLPPIGTVENFSIQIAVVDLSSGQRKVESIRTVNIAFKDNTLNQYAANIKAIDDQNQEFSIEVVLPAIKRCMATISVKESKTFQLKNEPDAIDQGWLQHPVYPQLITKRFGLSYQTRIHIIRQLYSQFDLMKDYLQGDNFGLLQRQQYNDFLLRPESFEAFYDLLIHHVAYYKQGDFIFDRLPSQRICELNLLELPVDFHDSVVLTRLQEEISTERLQNFKQLFTDSESLQQEIFFIHTKQDEKVPSVDIEVFYEVDFLENKIKADQNKAHKATQLSLVPNLLQTPSIDIGE